MHNVSSEKSTHSSKGQPAQFPTLIPGIVTLEEPPQISEETGAGQDGPPLRGFQGVVRSLNESALTFDAEIRAEKVIEKAKGKLFATIGTARMGNLCSLRVGVMWAKNYETKELRRRCLVGLEIIPTKDQIKQLGIILSGLKGGKALCKEFVVDRTVYFGDTNVEGNVYFAKFFEWQGSVREAFYLQIMPDAIGFLKSGIRIITAEARIQFKSQFILFDQVTIEVKAGAIRTGNIELLFLYRKKLTGEIAAFGSQTLAFTNESGQIISVPQEVSGNLEPYLDPYYALRTYL